MDWNKYQKTNVHLYGQSTKYQRRQSGRKGKELGCGDLGVVVFHKEITFKSRKYIFAPSLVMQPYIALGRGRLVWDGEISKCFPRDKNR